MNRTVIRVVCLFIITMNYIIITYYSMKNITNTIHRHLIFVLDVNTISTALGENYARAKLTHLIYTFFTRKPTANLS